MAFVPAAAVVQAELRFTQDAQQIENVLHFKFGAPPVTVGAMEALGDAIITWWDTVMQPLTSNTISFREVYLTDLTTATSPTVTRTTGLPLLGALTEEALPNNIALCVSFRTNGRGRSSRGRNYVAGVTDNNIIGNNFASVWADAVVQAYATLADDLLLEDWTHGVLSRILNGVDRTTGLFQPVISYLTMDYIADSQRRRLPGRGS